MDIEILPHIGLASFRIGMSFDEAMAVAEGWGSVKHSPAGERPPGKYVVEPKGYDFDFVLIFRQDETLNSIEMWRFRDEEADVRVTLEGMDVFRTPKKQLRRQIEERGHALERNDLGFDAVPELNIIFANASSYEYPTDPRTGAPLYFDYVLVSDRITP
ncbi:hypothetical protein [Streptomyces sp. NEAU-S77]|uniref:hypothetical protein n=1 Tax=Streptomyces sp. NEAU-S77 TaxID=3411033 RepID=UPI003BA279F8